MRKINIKNYIQKVGTGVSLSSAEREKMREVLSEYIAIKPAVRDTADVRHRQEKGNFLSSLFTITKKPMPIALILALLFSGSVSYAAEGTLPGDTLYPVKIHVNENLQTALALSTEAKAALHGRLAERRLEEATNLAAKNTLNADTKADLSASFSEHADAAVTGVTKLSEDNAAAAIDVASNLETGLAAHGTLLAQVNNRSDAKSKVDVGDLVALVHEKARLVSAIRAHAEGNAEVSARAVGSASARAAGTVNAKSDASANADAQKTVSVKMGTMAKAAIANAEKAFAAVSVKLDAAVAAAVKLEISVASSLAATGDTLSAKGDFTAAFHAYQQAFVTVKKLSVYLNAAENTDIKVPAILHSDSSTEAKAESSGESNGNDNNDADSGILPNSLRIEGDASVETHAGASVNGTGGGASGSGSGSGSIQIGL